MANNQQAAPAPAASSPTSTALQPISGAPLVNRVEVVDNGKLAWMTGAGVVAGLCIAGPLGAVVGGGVMAAYASNHKHKRIVAVEVFPYGIQSVHLPADGVREVNGVQYFAIDVTPTSGSKWRVMRRYNDFDILRRDLRSHNRAAARHMFAPKRWHKISGYLLDQRREMLQAWLSHQLQVSNRTPGYVRRLRPFLENARGVVPAPGSTNQTQAALPPLPEQPLPRNQFLQVTVPEGAVPGTELIAVAPDGRNIKVVVPQGAAPGTLLKVIVPTTATAPVSQSASSSATAAATAAAAAAAGASASSAVADAAAGPVRQQSGEVLQLQVPAGASPGMSIGVELPGGRRVQMTVPEGFAAGDEIQMWYEPATGTLTPLPQEVKPHKPETPPAPSVAEATQLLSVPIPAGVLPGGQFAVLCPDGRQIPVVLPQEAAGKGELQVKFNALAGTVTPVV
mmetsp:Transcript_62540/g.116273  ORF Transcript_62540/g.116273 Transcript_62540/m.116273 type:complete len:452 (-) Transcript_62540:148-1503(-)